MFKILLIGLFFFLEGVSGVWAASHYVGSETCRDCHPLIYQGWRSTLHPYTLRQATPETVLSEWKNTTLNFGKKKIRLEIRGGNYWMVIERADQKARYRVDYVFGGNWKQIYLTVFPNGEIHILPLSWLVEDKKWELNKYWPKVVYQYKCMGCHVTGLEIQQDEKGRLLRTEFRELGVGCEACHGPGDEHVKAPKERKSETIVNPARIPYARMAAMVCGACHNRGETPDGLYRYPVGFIPGGSFDFNFIFKPLIYPDGSSKANYQQYRDWLESGHYRAGVMCWDCHEVHGKGRANRFQTKLPGSNLCRSCHKVDNKGVHGLHSVNNCVGCHMPLVGRRGISRDVHSHRFKVIYPSWTLKIGSFEKQPNSCNACHYHRKENPEKLQKLLDYAKEVK